MSAAIIEVIRGAEANKGSSTYIAKIINSELSKDMIETIQEMMIYHVQACDYLWLLEIKEDKTIELIITSRVLFYDNFLKNCEIMLRDIPGYEIRSMKRKIINDSFYERLDNNITSIIKNGGKIHGFISCLEKAKEGILLDVITESNSYIRVDVEEFFNKAFLENFVVSKPENKYSYLINLIRFDFSLNNYILSNDMVFEKKIGAKVSWIPVFTLKKYLKRILERVSFLENNFGPLIYSVDKDALLRLSASIPNLLLKQEMIFFQRFEKINFDIIEYANCCFDLTKHVVLEKDDNKMLLITVPDVFSTERSNELFMGVFSKLPIYCTDLSIKIIFCNSFMVQNIICHAVDSRPEVLPKNFFLLSFYSIHILIPDLLVKHEGKLFISLSNKLPSWVLFSELKTLIFIILNNRKNLVF